MLFVDQEGLTPRWHCLGVVAADASKMRLFLQDATRRCVQEAVAFALYLPGVELTLAGKLYAPCVGERQMLFEHLDGLGVSDLLVPDQCYPARWLIALLAQRGIPLCMRVDETGFAGVKAFLRSGEAAHGVIEAVTPWTALVAAVEPHYPKGEGRGRPPIGVDRMLRMYNAQQCFGLSDEGIEDAIYDSQAIRRFVGIDLTREAAPDATTLLRFRCLLETHDLSPAIFSAFNHHLADKGLMLKEGSIVDATIIAAPSSTKNQDRRFRRIEGHLRGSMCDFAFNSPLTRFGCAEISICSAAP